MIKLKDVNNSLKQDIERTVYGSNIERFNSLNCKYYMFNTNSDGSIFCGMFWHKDDREKFPEYDHLLDIKNKIIYRK